MRAVRLTAVALVAFTSTANADWYSCKDPPYGGDSPPAQCKGEICVTKANGARTCTRPPESTEQRKKREEQEKRQRECAKRALDKQRDAHVFLDKYQTDRDIQTEQDRAIAEQQRIIDGAQQRLEAGKTKAGKLAEEAKFYTQHPMPDELRRDIESNRKLLDLQEQDLASAREGKRQIIDRYDAMRQRREDLIQNGVRAEPCDPG